MSKTTKKLKVLMLGAEVAPFAKVGGLADVVGSLPIALKNQGVDIRLIMPLYASIDRKKFKLKKIESGVEIPSGLGLTKIDIWKTNLPGSRVPIYFIDSSKYFRYNQVYTSGDNSERFLFYSYAALYVTPIIKFKPDIVHCQDSHTALVSDILKTTNFEFLQGIKTLYTIHNFRYQGKSGIEILHTGNLSEKALKTLSDDARDGDINYTVQGVLNADIVNTVSSKYADEILTKRYGEGLDNIIKKRKSDLYGIVNGIDTKFFDPIKDKYITKRFSEKSISKKVENKVKLQERLGLPVYKEKALIGLVSRLVTQKGILLISEKICKQDCQLVFLGTGHSEREEHLKDLAKKFPDNVSTNIMFDLELAQQIYAGSDLFLMPSRFEPCGLGQMIAMRYGTLPIAHATGGLDDTVDDKVGFKFSPLTKASLNKTVKEALNVYYNDKKRWNRMIKNAMKRDFSWDKSAKEYIKLYKKALKK